MKRATGDDRFRLVLEAFTPALFSILAACGGGGGSGGDSTGPNPTIPQPTPAASITSFSIGPDTVDLRDAVTFEWRTDPPDTGSPDFTLALTGHGDVTGRSPLTIDDIRFGGTYTLRMTRGNGTFATMDASLEIRPDSIGPGFVGVLNDNLLVWHGWKLDHRQPVGTYEDYVRMLYEHGIVQDVFDWIVFIDGVADTEHYAYAGSFARLNDRGARGFTDGDSAARRAADRYNEDVLRTDHLRGLAHMATNRYTAHSLVHEIMHQWANRIVALGVGAHWGFSDVHGPLGGFDGDTLRVFDAARDHHAARAFSDIGGTESDDLPYSPLEMYLAGWGPLSDVPPIKVAHNADWVRDANDTIMTSDEMNYTEYVFHAPEDFTSYGRDWLIDTLGPRDPPLGEAPTDFRLLFVYMVDDEFPALIEQLGVVSGEIVHMTQHADAKAGEQVTFWQAAHGMATIRGDGLSDVLDQTIEPGQHTVVCHFRRDTDLCEGVRPSVRLELDLPGRVMACRHDPVAGWVHVPVTE